MIATAIVLCTLLNWEHSPRCTAPVDYFIVEENGEAWGALTSGVTFTQTNITYVAYAISWGWARGQAKVPRNVYNHYTTTHNNLLDGNKGV
jgi:hypothetical protein